MSRSFLFVFIALAISATTIADQIVVKKENGSKSKKVNVNIGDTLLNSREKLNDDNFISTSVCVCEK